MVKIPNISAILVIFSMERISQQCISATPHIRCSSHSLRVMMVVIATLRMVPRAIIATLRVVPRAIATLRVVSRAIATLLKHTYPHSISLQSMDCE